MYLCDYCGAAFQSLDYIEEKSDECGNSIIYVCPECGEEIIPEKRMNARFATAGSR